MNLPPIPVLDFGDPLVAFRAAAAEGFLVGLGHAREVPAEPALPFRLPGTEEFCGIGLKGLAAALCTEPVTVYYLVHIKCSR